MLKKKPNTPTEGRDKLTGTAGNDTIAGLGGNDIINGGGGDDVLTGGRGDDDLRGGTGGDIFIWARGDGADRIDGGAGKDLIDMLGSSVTDEFLLSARGAHLRIGGPDAERIDAVALERVVLRLGDSADDVVIDDLTGSGIKEVLIDASFALSTGQGDIATDDIRLAGTAGKDVIAVTEVVGGVDVTGLSAQVRVVGSDLNDLVEISGGNGDDVIDAIAVGSGGAHLVLNGGDGNDVVTGSRGDDTVDLGAGNDRYHWSLGEGSDTIEGRAGRDALLIDAAGFDGVAAIGVENGHAAVGIGGALLDFQGVETVSLHATGGKATVFIGDLSGTDVSRVSIDLSAPSPKDERVQGVLVLGTHRSDTVVAQSKGDTLTVTGLAAEIAITGAKGNALAFSGGEGNDVFRGDGAAGVTLILTGDDGDDRLIGGSANDEISGGEGADRASGGRGDDSIDLGAGDDVFTYRTGDGDDVVSGGDGEDTIVFAATAETDEILFGKADAELRLIDDHSKGPDAFGVEHAVWFGGAGRDGVRVADTSGTGLEDILLDLAAKQGDKHGDGEVDLLTLFGTGGSDLIELRGSGDTVTVFGMSAVVTAAHLDTDDRIVVEGGEGDDLLLVSTSAPDPGRFTMLGEGGNDVIFGGNGDEALDGGVGDDEIGGGAGQDVMTGGAGADVFSFFGANDSTGRIDVIKDFHHLEGDRIDLSAVDADPATLDDEAFRFIDTAAFDGGHGELRVVYDAGGATIAADLDGDKTADFEVRLAGVTADHALILGDFVL